MKEIESYIDSLFHNAKKSQETEEAYIDVQTYLEEVYWETLDRVKDKELALQEVIEKHGNSEQLFRVLDLNIDILNEPSSSIGDARIDDLFRWRTIYAAGIASSIFLILIAIGLLPLMVSSYESGIMGFLYSTMQIMQPVVAAMCIIGCVLFINVKYKKIPRNLSLSKQKRAEIRHKKKRFQISIVVLVVIGLFLCIVAMSMFILLYSIINIEVALITSISIAASAIWMFCFVGINNAKYRLFLN